MQTEILYAQGDKGAASRLASLLETLGIGVGSSGADTPTVALFTPIALGDGPMLRRFQEKSTRKTPLLHLVVVEPATFPTPDDLARVVEWLNTPAQSSASKYHIVNPINSVIGEGNVVVHVAGGGQGWSAAETARLTTMLREQPSAVPMSADELRALFAQVQTQILQVDDAVRLGLSAVLARFDASEQRIIGPIMARLDVQHTSEMAALLDVFDAVAISADDLTQLLAAVNASLCEVKDKSDRIADKVLTSSANQLAELVDAPAFDVKHKLKVTLPIIPLLVEYEGEIELNSRLNLESAWREFKRVFLKTHTH